MQYSTIVLIVINHSNEKTNGTYHIQPSGKRRCLKQLKTASHGSKMVTGRFTVTRLLVQANAGKWDTLTLSSVNIARKTAVLTWDQQWRQVSRLYITLNIVDRKFCCVPHCTYYFKGWSVCGISKKSLLSKEHFLYCRAGSVPGILQQHWWWNACSSETVTQRKMS